MRKKLFKYTKFVVSMVLILGLVAPSYASLSASDGSAFVTKAEFDSALADFNSRLTTFEAGINSKIDSQVTSYLDRNGIWNGKDQIENIINKYTYWWGFKSQQVADNISNWQLKFNHEFQQNNLYQGWINNVIVKENTNGWSKSGLLTVEHLWMGFGPEAWIFLAGPNGTESKPTTGGDGSFGKYWNVCMSLNLEITSGNNKISRRLGYGDVGDYHLIKSNLHFEDFNCMDIMFVNKGEVPVWTTTITGSGTWGVPLSAKFAMNALSFRNQATIDPVASDWDMEARAASLQDKIDASSMGGIFSCGWYKVKGLKIY